MKTKFFEGFKSRLKKPKKEKKPYDLSPVNVRLTIPDDDDGPIPESLPPGIEIKREKTNRSAEDDVFDSLNGSAHKEAFRFTPNSKYTSILIYAIIFVVIATLIFLGFQNGTLIGGISKFFNAAAPFIVGLFVALVLERPVSWLEENLWSRVFTQKPRVGLKRALSVTLTYLLLFGLIFILFRFVIPQLIQSLKDLTDRSEDMYNELIGFIDSIEERLPGVEHGDVQKLIKKEEILGFITSKVMPNILNVTMTTAKTFFNIIISLIVSIYILFDKRNLKVTGLRFVYSVLPISRGKRVSNVISECTDIFTNFVFGKTLDSLIIGLLSFIVLSIGGFQYTVLVAVIIGVTNMIPYFGPFIGAVPGAIIYLCFSPRQAFAFLIIVLIIQQLDGLVIGPKILGDSTGLSPLWVIIGTTLGGAYAGVLGMFLGVPVIAVISYLTGNLFDTILKNKKIEVS